MEDGRILHDLLFGEEASGKTPTSRPQLRFKVCKKDLKATDIDAATWGTAAPAKGHLEADGT